jgi:multicomponent Na+:H+ antiporter subunit E
MMYRIRTIIALTFVYLALTANLALINILTGALLATAVAFLLPSGSIKMHWRDWPAVTWALLRYILILAWDLIISGVQVARIVLSPTIKIEPGIIAIPSETDSELATALSAHAITLTPGELVVEIGEDCVMYTHVLDATQAEQSISRAQAKRRDLLQKIFQ